MKADSLRKKYPRFIYQKYSYRLKRDDLKISFYFKIEPDIVFKPKIVVKNIPPLRLEKVGKMALNNFVFHLGLIEMLSYWKTTCSPEIVVRAGYLDKNQADWWHELIIKGMGQFFYENRIDWRDPDFLKISVNPGIAAPALGTAEIDLKDRYLVPLAGGKDSLVTLESLKKEKESLNSFLLNPTKIIKRVARVAGLKKPIIAQRWVDQNLLALNQKGYLNGHTPFTALLSFLAALCAALFDYQHIAFSNEKSADEGNVRYLGKTINHQWAKSSEFEKMFRTYCQKYLAKNIDYFSYLRGYTELEIAKMFTKYPKYFAVFSSCNASMKIQPAAESRWCGQCPKCLFVYLMLYPYLEKKQLLKIFGKDLFEDKRLLPLLKSLVGQGRYKPFECVGTYRESKKAFELSLKKAKKSGKVPYLLQN